MINTNASTRSPLHTNQQRQQQELYLRHPARFNVAPGQPVTFAELAEAVRLTGQTAVGYVRAGRLAVLAPRADHYVQLEHGDRVVVIAEEY